MDLKRIRRICSGMAGSDKKKQFAYLSQLGIYNKMPDEDYIKKKYRLYMGKNLNLENPESFNEKIQWLKLHDHNERYINMVDKYEVKNYVADKIGEEYIIPTYGIWNSAEELNIDQLPKQFVLKCTHDAGSVIICMDKGNFNIAAAKTKLKRCLKKNFYFQNREWVYKNIRPRVIAEKYISDRSTGDLRDYKIYNFNGRPRIIQVSIDRFTKHKLYFFNTDWQYIGTKLETPADSRYLIEKPAQLGEMLALAQKLSENIPFVRTDFYCFDSHIYFGEYTFYPAGGYGKFVPEQLDYELGREIKII